jgi:hypothetical protein
MQYNLTLSLDRESYSRLKTLRALWHRIDTKTQLSIILQANALLAKKRRSGEQRKFSIGCNTSPAALNRLRVLATSWDLLSATHQADLLAGVESGLSNVK